MSGAGGSDALTRCVAALKSASTPSARATAAHSLRLLLRTASRGAGGDASAAASATIAAAVYSLLASPEPSDKLAGIAAIGELADEPSPDQGAWRR